MNKTVCKLWVMMYIARNIPEKTDNVCELLSFSEMLNKRGRSYCFLWKMLDPQLLIRTTPFITLSEPSNKAKNDISKITS